MKPHKTKNKCSICNNKAWIISSKINIPVYCRTCYNQLVNKCDELSTWCDKCGHKIPVCENHRICKKKQSKVIVCYGCWFNKNNIKNRETIKFFSLAPSVPNVHSFLNVSNKASCWPSPRR